MSSEPIVPTIHIFEDELVSSKPTRRFATIASIIHFAYRRQAYDKAIKAGSRLRKDAADQGAFAILVVRHAYQRSSASTSCFKTASSLTSVVRIYGILRLALPRTLIRKTQRHKISIISEVVTTSVEFGCRLTFLLEESKDLASESID